MRASQRDTPEVQAERAAWIKSIDGIDPNRWIFIDETGVRTNIASRYGWSMRGMPCIGVAPASWKSFSTVAAISLGGVGVATSVEGAFNKPSFREYMEDILLPTLKRGAIVVMDNLSVHKNSFDIKKFTRRGIEIRYLPRYSPDLNPIEFAWAKVKGYLRKACPRDGDQIWHAMNSALWEITPDNIAGWFRGCGYLH